MCGMSLPTFQNNLLPPSSGLKSKPSVEKGKHSSALNMEATVM
jgi:hypothetical protein